MTGKPDGPSKGEAAGTVVQLHKPPYGYPYMALVIPDKIIEELGWKEGDEIDIEDTELCETWGETKGIVLRNLTKEREDETK